MSASSGWPRRYPVAQPPNAALVAVAAAAIAVRLLEGEARGNAATAYWVASSIWAADEAARGANALRRLLGLAVFIHASTGLRRRFAQE